MVNRHLVVRDLAPELVVPRPVELLDRSRGVVDRPEVLERRELDPLDGHAQERPVRREPRLAPARLAVPPHVPRLAAFVHEVGVPAHERVEEHQALHRARTVVRHDAAAVDVALPGADHVHAEDGDEDEAEEPPAPEPRPPPPAPAVRLLAPVPIELPALAQDARERGVARTVQRSRQEPPPPKEPARALVARQRHLLPTPPALLRQTLLRILHRLRVPRYHHRRHALLARRTRPRPRAVSARAQLPSRRLPAPRLKHRSQRRTEKGVRLLPGGFWRLRRPPHE
mmetsp:Transcript_13698/g.45066  ORF Transcript_13698/g.45066 Transcript_13698/m.45066 type:complete len:284 (+) Transcript_13698:2405-3256(+)